jgi:adenylate kinase
MLRAAMRAVTEVGLTAKAILEQGGLVPDKIVVDLVSARLKSQIA